MRLKFLALSCALLGLSSVFNPLLAKEKKKPVGPKIVKEERVNDWFYRCIENVNKKTHCGLFQDVIGEDDKSKSKFPVLSLQIYDNPNTKKRTMTFRAPHGVLLSQGISFKIGSGKKETLGFATCLAEPLGCTASIELSSAMEKNMKKASEIKVEYKSFFSQKPITIPLKATGYSKAAKKL